MSAVSMRKCRKWVGIAEMAGQVLVRKGEETRAHIIWRMVGLAPLASLHD